MRPLIPRVRVGDVLLGTRNLRHYLQTAATLNYLNEVCHLESRGERQRSKSQLYHPGKDDEFLVAVNAWGNFGVYGSNGDLVLLFRNGNSPGKPKPNKKGPFIPSKQFFNPPVNNHIMTPTIFSKWFIRTPQKRVDLADWPSTAYFMWATLHLNLNTVPKDGAPNFYCQTGPTGPFMMHSNARPWKRDQLKDLIVQWAVRGVTREAGLDREGSFSMGGFGPRLEEIPSMRREIERLCSNPRVARHLKLEDNNVYQAFVENQ